MNETLKDFFHCIDEMAMAERRKEYREMWKWHHKAAELPVVNHLQAWILEYTDCISKLLYGSDENGKELCRRLFVLRNKVTVDEDPPYDTVKELYIRLLVQLLQKQYLVMDTVPEYEELMRELIERVEHEHRYDLDGDDLFAFSYGVAGTYFRKKRDYLQSEAYYIRIWFKARNDEVLSRYAFSSLVELIRILWFQGKGDQACEVGIFLKNALSQNKVQIPFQPDVHRYTAAYAMAMDSIGERKDSFGFLEESLDAAWFVKTEITDELAMVYTLLLGNAFLQKRNIKAEHLKSVHQFFGVYRKKTDFSKLPAWRKSNLCLMLFYMKMLKRIRNNHCSSFMRETKHLDRSAKILMQESFPEEDRMAYLTGMLQVIRNYHELDEESEVLKCVEHLMYQLLVYVSDLGLTAENVLLDRYLAICKLSFHMAYMASLQIAEPVQRMEFSMNGKHLLTSVLRIRNQPVEGKTGKNAVLQWYTMNQLAERIPQNTAVLELIYLEPQVWRKGMLRADSVNDQDRILEIFLLTSQNGTAWFRHKCVKQAAQLDKKLEEYIKRIQSSKGKTRGLAGDIYACFASLLDDLPPNIEQLWICPDLTLCNFPFEVLLHDVSPEKEKWEIVYWKSLRDIFMDGKKCEFAKKSCVICPEFNTDTNYNPLPFSAFEAHQIAELLNGRCYIGADAVPGRLHSGCRYIHISTHGVCFPESENTWYGRGVVLSAETPMMEAYKQSDEMTGESEKTRHQILTADTISRMDLSGVELVMLSACYSGNSPFNGMQEPNGLHIAFGIAGVRYVISALWQVDDLASMIFALYFYQQLKEEENVPKALRIARRRLREITAGEVRRMLMMEAKREDPSVGNALEELGKMPEDFKLYHNKKSWGGFVCFQSCL